MMTINTSLIYCRSFATAAWVPHMSWHHDKHFHSEASCLQLACLMPAGLDFASFDSLEAAKAAAKEALEKSIADTDGTRTASMRNIDEATSSGRILAECFEAAVESSLQQPTFVLDFPVEISPLAKPHRSKPGLVERFELYIAGKQSVNFMYLSQWSQMHVPQAGPLCLYEALELPPNV